MTFPGQVFLGAMSRFSRCGGGIRGTSFVGPVLLLVVMYVTFQGAANVFYIESNVVHKLQASKYSQLGHSALAVTGEPTDSVFQVERFSGDEEVGVQERVILGDGMQHEIDASGHGLAEEFRRWKDQPPGLRVYMYELPREFTYGVIEQYQKSRDMLKTGKDQVDDAHLRYPGNQHSAEWYIFSDLLKAQSSNGDSVALRVDDPREADVFYVPFFSSLSLVVNMVPELKDPTYSDEEMQQQLVLWLEQQPTWQKSRGRNHVVVAQDPNALFKVKDRLRTAIMLVSDFGRMKPEEGSLVKDVVIPYSHRITSYVHENDTLARDTLLFFMGNRYRKEGGKIRDDLFQLLENEADMFIRHGTQSRESRRMATQGMRTSKFCLHPAGDTPSACRLFDAIVSLCVPVIVSDFLELPFEDQLDYSEFAIFIPTSKALEPDYLANYLRNVSPQKLSQYHQRLREVRKYFEYETPDGAVDQIWRQVLNKMPLVRQMIHRDKRIVKGIDRGEDCACICSNRTMIDSDHYSDVDKSFFLR